MNIRRILSLAGIVQYYSQDNNTPPDNEIWYTTSNNSNKISPYCPSIGSNSNGNFGNTVLISNTYIDGKGVLKFDRPVTLSSFTFGKDNTDGNLTSIHFPKTVTGSSSIFTQHRDLYECIMYDGITSIPSCAFKKCNSLSNITIPSTVTSLNEQSFAYAGASLAGIIHCNPINVPTLGRNVLQGAYGKFIVPYESLSLYKSSIPDTGMLTILPTYNILSCTNISVSQSDNVEWYDTYGNIKTNVTYSVKYADGSVGNLTIPKKYMFNFEANMTDTSIYRSYTITEYGYSVSAQIIHKPYYDVSMTSILYESTDNTEIIPSIDKIKLHSYGNISVIPNIFDIPVGAYYLQTNLKNITIPEGITTIYGNAFNGCSNLKNIILPKTLSSVVSTCFTNACTNVSSITIVCYSVSVPSNFASALMALPNSITKYIYVPYDSLQAYGNALSSISYCYVMSMFEPSSCIQLNISNVPSSVAWHIDTVSAKISGTYYGRYYDGSYGEYSFEDTSTYNIGRNLTDASVNKVISATKLYRTTTATIIQGHIDPSQITTITYTSTDGTSEILPAFSNIISHSYGTITVGDVLTSFDSSLYANKTLLQTINIPSSITSLGNNCFKGCTGLTSITVPATVTSIGSTCFSKVLCPIHLYNLYSVYIYSPASTALSTAETRILYLHADTVPSGYNLSTMLPLGGSKQNFTYNIFTDNVTLKTQALALADSYTVVVVKHINGSDW